MLFSHENAITLRNLMQTVDFTLPYILCIKWLVLNKKDFKVKAKQVC